MNYFIRLFCCIWLIGMSVGCGKKKPGKDGILSVDKMKMVMWDVMLVDEFAGTFLSKDSLLDISKESAKMYGKVFGIYKISSQQFYNSYDFYRTHPGYFKTLLDSISAYGNRQRDSGYNKTRQLIPEN